MTLAPNAVHADERRQRDVAIADAYGVGEPVRVLAASYGLSRQAVYAILHRAGISTALRCRLKPERHPRRCRVCERPISDHTTAERADCRRVHRRQRYWEDIERRRAYNRAAARKRKARSSADERIRMNERQAEHGRRYRARLQEGTRERAVRHKARWSETEDRYILEHLDGAVREIAVALGRSALAVQMHRRRLLRRQLRGDRH
jgi:hypothetical protein